MDASPHCRIGGADCRLSAPYSSRPDSFQAIAAQVKDASRARFGWVAAAGAEEDFFQPGTLGL
tara:strand:- start:285 stop:473 length:189 start_codon:yes stop_codon:yes gene_type:complete